LNRNAPGASTSCYYIVMFSRLIRYKERILSSFVYLILFLYSIFPYSDKDWGWHYRYGEYLLTQGKILTQDIFTWTMQGMKWANPSWLYDPLLYLLTKTVGYVGLSIIGALVFVSTFYILISNFKLSYWKKAILAFFFILIAQVAIGEGLRSQVLSLLFFSILMSIIIKSLKNIKVIFFLPILFLLWVNFHGDFAAGLGIAGLFLGSYFLIDLWKTKKFSREKFLTLGATLLLSFAVTFINPFGYHAYLEVLSNIGSPYIKNILEWLPIYDNCPYCHIYIFAIYSFTTLLLFVKRRNLYDIPYILAYLILLIPTIQTRRLLPIFLIVTMPVLCQILEEIVWNIDQFKVTSYAFFLIIVVCIEFAFFNRYSSDDLYHYSETDFANNLSSCSLNAVNYLLSHPPKGKGFNFYDWGGYLIGKGLPAKIYIDGRNLAMEQTGYMPFSGFISMYYQNNYDLFNKYDFDWVFVQTNSNIANKLYYTKDLGNWKVEFSDTNATYFVRIR